jgi:site-specific DNA-cytosine methylase
VDTRTQNVISICSGLGGIELGLRSVIDVRTVCYVEREASACAILASRIGEGILDDAPIWDDLTTFDPEPFRGKVDLLCGGPPCQPFSFAGSQKGSADSRNLFPEVLRIADGLGLPDLFLENVPGILRFYWDNIRPQLREMGYSVAEGLFTASETGAPHKRERLFILAHSASVDDTEGTRWGVHNAADTGTIYGDVYTSPDASNHELAHAGCLQRPESRGVSPLAGELRTGETNPSTPCCADELAHADSGFSNAEGKEICPRGEPSEPGSGELAHAEEYGVQEPRPTNQPKGKHASAAPISNGEALAHADGLGHVHEQPGVEPDHRGINAQRHAAEGGGELADTERIRPLFPEQQGRPRPGEGISARSGSELADTGGEGLQRVRFAQQGEYAPGRGDVPLYPPAPNDHAGWEWLLARWPELAPTYCKDGHDVQPEMSQIECEFCGSSDGPTQELPTEVLLRGIGNGVVPAVAALAFSTLSRVLRAG